MSNQLTELFDMTDTRDVPDAAIEVLLKLARRLDVVSAATVRRDAQNGCRFDCVLIAFARHIAREHPEWIEDPDLATVRRICAEIEGENKGYQYTSGERDDYPAMQAALAAFKAGRAAERAGQ